MSTASNTLVLQGSPADYTFITDGSRLAIGDHVAKRDGLIQTQLSSITSIQFLGSNETYALADVRINSALEYIASYADLRDRFTTNAAAGYNDYVTYGYLLNRTVTFDALKYIASSSDLMSVFGADRAAGARHAIIYYYAYAESSWRANDQTIQTQLATNGVHVLTGTTGNDGLFGLAGDDYLYGSAGSDGLSGGAGNDWLDGGTGADRMAGGSGNDAYIVDNANDLVDESTNGNGSGDSGGIDTVLSSVNFDLGNRRQAKGPIEILVLTGTDDIFGVGNGLNNQLIGNSGSNRLSSGAGNDTLDGGLGADRMIGGSGNDVYLVDNANDVADEAVDGAGLNDAGGIDTVLSSVSFSLSDTEHAIGNIETLILTGSANVNASGNTANNVLLGNLGDNFLYGGDGDDALFGGAGNDTLAGGAGNDVYYFDRNSGNDTIIAEQNPSAYSDTLVINASADQLWLHRTGDDLSIDIRRRSYDTEAESTITIKNHYLGAPYQVGRIISNDNKVLTPTAATMMVEMSALPTRASDTTLVSALDDRVPADSSPSPTLTDSSIPVLSTPGLIALPDPRAMLWFPTADKQVSLLINAMATMGAPGMNGSSLTATNTQAKVEALFAANII